MNLTEILFEYYFNNHFMNDEERKANVKFCNAIEEFLKNLDENKKKDFNNLIDMHCELTTIEEKYLIQFIINALLKINA